MRPAARCASLVPLRDYIQRSLYAPRDGYFSADAAPVLRHEERTWLSTLPGRDAYERRVAMEYRNALHGWMTPVEIFSPFLSNAIAHRVATTACPNQPLAVVEIGGGRGTLAADVLHCLRENHQAVYERATYHLVEISPALADLQAKTLAEHIATGKAVVHTQHALDWISTVGEHRACPIVGQHCHIIATEVLDNLPHDFLRCEDGVYWQAFVADEEQNGRCSIEWSSELDAQTLAACQAFNLITAGGQTVNNSYLSSFRFAFDSMMDGGVSHMWCPTVLHQILEAIAERIPMSALTLTDFTSFPGALPHTNGPVIQRVERGVAKVYDSIEDAPFGVVDIMFPTNFQQLSTAYHQSRARSSHKSRTSVMTQHQFFRQFAKKEDLAGSTCKDGFNPILTDFANVCFFLADPVHP